MSLCKESHTHAFADKAYATRKIKMLSFSSKYFTAYAIQYKLELFLKCVKSLAKGNTNI